ncbi:MAG: hypothetical protein DRO87_06105 [Candidatus Thorarchaeota archaeon]|nr:MAG: hypothetical protein DRP09_09020 [Candidatus Thorarchaeota archaeon]RLI58152.1 MAG: hypothetical protein DRO87_06105 [Candidatus Thorarchaeota archaeon]
MLQIPILDWTLADLMAFFQNDWNLAWVLILSGGLTAIWLFGEITDPIPVVRTIFDGLVAIGTYLGFFVGILDLFVGYVVWNVQPAAGIIAGVLIVMGFSLVMRVLTKFPLALIFALAVAVFGTSTVYGFLQPYTSMIGLGDIIAQVISVKGLIVIGFIIFCVVYVLSDLLIKVMALIGKVFASKPVSVLVGLVAIAVGVLVLLNPALLGLVAWP